MAGTTDTVPAMLTPGEFVIKQESAAMLGEPLLQKLNAVSDNAPQGYQEGGGVSQNSGAHGNIDALIIQAQLASMVGYEEGGGVETGDPDYRDKLDRWMEERGYVTDKFGGFSGSWGDVRKVINESQRLRAEQYKGLSPAQRLFQRIRARQGEKEIPMTPEENEWLLTGLSPSRRKWRDASTGSPPSVDKPMTSGKKSIRDYIGRLRNGASDYEPEKPSLPGFEKPRIPGFDNEPALPDMGYRLGYQEGGSISPYNLGGSVTQQPMAYQLGGLLKYKRSPMMG